MPHYVTLLRYTQQDAAKIKESPAGSMQPRKLQRLKTAKFKRGT